MRRSLLLASTLLTQAALLSLPAAAQPVPAVMTETAAVRLRSGQHADRGRVVLHLGKIPAHTMRKTSNGFELRLRGRHRLDLAGTRPLREVAGLEARQEGEETVLLLRGPAIQAETGSFDGMLYIDLRASPPGLEAAQRKLLEDAVRLKLMRPEQAEALLHAARGGETQPAATLPRPPEPAGPQAAAALPPPPKATGDDFAALREAVIAKLAVLNGLRPADMLPSAPSPSPSQPATPALVSGPPAAAAPAPPPPAPPPPPPPPLPAPSCPATFSLRGWTGPQSFAEALPALRAALARSDQGTTEAVALAEFYAGHELAREALVVLEGARGEAPAGLLRERLERVRDVATLLLGRPIPPHSPLLAPAADCQREDLPLWQALAAMAGDGAALAPLAPRARAALREVPQALRLSFVQRLADAVENDPATLRILLGAIRADTGLSPTQAAARNWQYARLARQEGNRADEQQYLEQALRGGGRSLPEIQARARLAALNLGRPGAEGRRAEAQINDTLRTYRYEALGEEAAMAYADRLLEQGALGAALAVADGASQASARPGVESRGARLAATALRRLLANPAPDGQHLPPPDERLGLFWQYEGYATPGERGDDIRLAAVTLLLRQGLAETARDLAQQITPATMQRPEAMLLLARVEALAAQGDPRRALALLASLPPDEASRRVAAEALARLGRMEEAAAQLEGLRDTGDLSRRAELLFQARSWRAAGAAYGALLRDPALPAPAREEATARLATAAALARQKADVPAELLAPETGSAAMLRLTDAPPSSTSGIGGLHGALARSREIEALLPSEGLR
ncbi:hypothetical protein [Roseomonas marmotae]|uniref:Tetratricopeptide repeat protein n=1 Tax=Roseomonas marmotae TaxID=2768161 RepID=A0ABS3KGG6_9PROT|nr:hypothetical protein [Roseomonas marmotae]MBO1076067.1 hypothetical protein [Roseomonas marmotae]QTI81306.1 hypothetical protein IAI58_18285 [Roseomonas marmotae]